MNLTEERVGRSPEKTAETPPKNPEKQPKKKKTKKPKAKYHPLCTIAKITGGLPLLLWMRPKMIYMGKSRKAPRGVILCPNHEGYTDVMLLLCNFWNRRLHFLATTDLYKNPVNAFFFKRFYCIPVDKENFNSDSMHEVSDVLRAGCTVTIFPEGTIEHGEGRETVDAFKGGAPLLAYLADASIVPIYLVPAGKWYQRRVTLVGDPIRIRDICRVPSMKAMEAASELIRNKIIEMKETYIRRKTK